MAIKRDESEKEDGRARISIKKGSGLCLTLDLQRHRPSDNKASPSTFFREPRSISSGVEKWDRERRMKTANSESYFSLTP